MFKESITPEEDGVDELRLSVPATRAEEAEAYSVRCGRSLGFELLLKSRCTWFWGTKDEMVSPRTPVDYIECSGVTVSRARTLQRQLSNPGAILSRRKRQLFNKYMKNIPLCALLGITLLLYVLYYQTSSAFSPLANSEIFNVPVIEVIQIENATFGGETVIVDRLFIQGKSSKKNQRKKTEGNGYLYAFRQQQNGTNQTFKPQNMHDKLLDLDGERGDVLKIRPVVIRDTIVSTAASTLADYETTVFKSQNSGKDSIKVSNRANEQDAENKEISEIPERGTKAKISELPKESNKTITKNLTNKSMRLPKEETKKTETKPVREDLQVKQMLKMDATSKSNNTKPSRDTSFRARDAPVAVAKKKIKYVKPNQAQFKQQSKPGELSEVESLRHDLNGKGKTSKANKKETENLRNSTIPKNVPLRDEKGDTDWSVLRPKGYKYDNNLTAASDAKDTVAMDRIKISDQLKNSSLSKAVNNTARGVGTRVETNTDVRIDNKILTEKNKPGNKNYTELVTGGIRPVPYRSQQNYSKRHRLMIVFTTFKRDPSRYRIHHNVIRNWASFMPAVVPVLYNDSTNSVLLELAKEFGWTIRQVPAYNQNGVPLLRHMYQDVQPLFPSSIFIGYANGDILFDEGLITTLEGVAKQQKQFNQTMVVGMRHNLFLQTRRLFWPHDVWLTVKNEALEAPVYAEDYFFIYRNKFPWHILPELVIGRPAYDNYLVAMAIKNNVSVVDASRTMSCLHQYGPGGLGAGRKNTDAGYNRELIGEFNFHDGYLDQAPFETTFDPKGNIVVWERNKERQQFLNNIRRQNMSSQWKENPKLYNKFVDHVQPGHEHEHRDSLKTNR